MLDYLIERSIDETIVVLTPVMTEAIQSRVEVLKKKGNRVTIIPLQAPKEVG